MAGHGGEAEYNPMAPLRGSEHGTEPQQYVTGGHVFIRSGKQTELMLFLLVAREQRDEEEEWVHVGAGTPWKIQTFWALVRKGLLRWEDCSFQHDQLGFQGGDTPHGRQVGSHGYFKVRLNGPGHRRAEVLRAVREAREEAARKIQMAQRRKRIGLAHEPRQLNAQHADRDSKGRFWHR